MISKLKYWLGRLFFKLSEKIDSDGYCKSCNSCGEFGCCAYRCQYLQWYLIEFKNDLKYIKTQLLAKDFEKSINQLDYIISSIEDKK